MFLKPYELEANKDFTSFKFISIGVKGRISKIIQFIPIGIVSEAVFNLAFGDKVAGTEDYDDAIVSDNGDAEKILITIAHTVFRFTNRNPGCWIYARGGSPSRNRLYRMGISKYLDVISKDFRVMGEVKEDWELFSPGKNYSAFLFKRKLYKFEE